MINLGMTYNSLTRLEYYGNSRSKPVKIKVGDEEKEYIVMSESITCEPAYSGFDFYRSVTVYSYDLREIVKVKQPSKEEVAAEESVIKAKEALKAAENALKVVKEKI